MPLTKQTKNADIRLSVHPVVRDLLDYEARKRGIQRASLVEEIITAALLDRAELRHQIAALTAFREDLAEVKAQIQAIADLIVDQSLRSR